MTPRKTLVSIIVTTGVAALLASCVDHRPVRNGLQDESIYLKKTDLTQVNPKLGEDSTDEQWLMKVTVAKASSPNVAGDYAFPGFESDTHLVKFRFKEDKLQLVDGRRLQPDNPTDPNDDLATTTERVTMEFKGRHVDVKLRESLDGERTNYLEENTEEPWQQRQQFKIDFETSSMDPITNIAWFYGDFLHDCVSPMSTNLVPDSYEWDEEDQHMTFVLEVNYKLKVATMFGACYDMVSLLQDVGTATIQYRFSFYRPGPSDFVPVEIAEKDPVNKQYGVFKVRNLFRDPDSGLLDDVNYIHRWDRNREEPVTFYFHPGFPEKFKPMFDDIADETNGVLEDSGAALRFEFKDHDWDGQVRHFGDLRHSFVVWHQDIDTTRGLLGYGPSSSDPRTGEIISANLNLYNIGMDYYRFLIQDYLQDRGGLHKPGDADTKWENISCEPGETVAPCDAGNEDEACEPSEALTSQLFGEMRRTMDLPGPFDGTHGDFAQAPQRDDFWDNYHRLLNEVRYINPGWNDYVWRPRGSPHFERYVDRLEVEREFSDSMHEVMMGENPFGPVALDTREGIATQLDFLEDFRGWKKNHDLLETEQQMLLGLNNIATFNLSTAIHAVSNSARRCTDDGKWESDEAYRDRIIEGVVYHVAIHEFGHNLSLRHNFYGSVDKKHVRENEVSASVMDYVRSNYEAATSRAWGGYDEAALTWIYGDEEKRAEARTHDFLYCTDEHRSNSPLCTAHDLGFVPSEIALNAIEAYDFAYKYRNKRAYRTFWDTSWYINQVYGAIFPLSRLWYLGIFDWGGGGVQETLKRLDQKSGGEVLSDQEYDAIAVDFGNDLTSTHSVIIAFFDALINQSATFRNYQTEFDPYYGDILRIGIILDKLFTVFAFVDLQDVYNYSPNVQTYVAMYDAPYGSMTQAVSQRVLDSMLGANYDTFPWFKYYATLIFASVTNSNLVGTLSLKERIAIERYENEAEFLGQYGQVALEQALSRDNPAQHFVHEGENYVYVYLPERAWHLVAGKSRSPVSFQYISDYNESLNASASRTADTFGLKILLAYYEYFNNFTGF